MFLATETIFIVVASYRQFSTDLDTWQEGISVYAVRIERENARSHESIFYIS